MYWLKSCPRCHGDLVGKIGDRFYPVTCLQCGYELRADEETRLQMPNEPVAIPAADVVDSASA